MIIYYFILFEFICSYLIIFDHICDHMFDHAFYCILIYFIICYCILMYFILFFVFSCIFMYFHVFSYMFMHFHVFSMFFISCSYFFSPTQGHDTKTPVPSWLSTMILSVPFVCRFMQRGAAAVAGISDVADKKFASIGYSWIQSCDLMTATGLSIEQFEEQVKSRSTVGHDEQIWHWRSIKKFIGRLDPLVLNAIRDFQSDFHQAEVFPAKWLTGAYLMTKERARTTDNLSEEQQMHWVKRVLSEACAQ